MVAVTPAGIVTLGTQKWDHGSHTVEIVPPEGSREALDALPFNLSCSAPPDRPDSVQGVLVGHRRSP